MSWPIKMRRRKTILVVAFMIPVLAVSVYGWYRYKFPYGYSHCCTAVLATSLYAYALEHDGDFPFSDGGEAESLALLIPENVPVEIMCGKTVDPDEAKAYYNRHGSLTSDYCGWRYRRGLTTADDARIALLWDKEPLGHNGQRTWKRSREVVFVGGRRLSVPHSEWDGFLQEQEALLADRDKEGNQQDVE